MIAVKCKLTEMIVVHLMRKEVIGKSEFSMIL